MKLLRKYKPQDISNWQLKANKRNELSVGGISVVDLAKTYGTPLHVVNREGLQSSCNEFLDTFGRYQNKTSIHFAFKCNPVPGVIQIIKNCGIKAEVMSQYELQLALLLGYSGNDIIVNGPHKPDSFLEECLKAGARCINIDSRDELVRLNRIAGKMRKKADILLRINPGYIPSGMNSGSATSSRKNSLFGLDLKGGELFEALKITRESNALNFKGFHFHIGSGILDPGDYKSVIRELRELVEYTYNIGLNIDIFDIGGGFGVATSREMNARELLYYQVVGKLPDPGLPSPGVNISHFFEQISNAINETFRGYPLPELISEPGRSLISSNQMLLVSISGKKTRKGLRTWIITDAGIGTAAMPVYYEFHELILGNDVKRENRKPVTITGPGCFSADIIYKNYRLPEVHPGEVLAIMDSGAYFTSWESNFGHPRPAIVEAGDNSHSLIRDRETFDHMIRLDRL